MTARAGSIAVRTRQPARRVRTVLSGSLLTALVVLGASACSSGSSGLPSTFSDAVGVMQDAGGYTFTASVTTGTDTAPSVTLTGDFQAPNLVAQTVTKSGAAPVAMVLDGGTVHVQDARTAAWTTQPATTSGTVDLRQAFIALSKANDVKVTGDTATFTLSGDAAKTLVGADVSGKATVSITLGPVGLAQLTYRATVGGRPVSVTLDYAAVGTAPKVTVPA